MSVDAKLLPCPFCGGDADIFYDHTVEENHEYGCRECVLWFGSSNSDDPIAAWNTRTPHPAPFTARGVELEAEIERLTARAKKAEAERDEARAQVKHMEGFDHCTCGPCPIHPDAALEARDREKVLEGMQRVIDCLRHEGQINPSLTYADAIDWAEYVRNEMETLK